MRLLLDTSYLYDIIDKPGAFLEQERRILAARDAEFHVSSVSLWELRLKCNARHPSGDRKSRFSPEDVITALADQEVVVSADDYFPCRAGTRYATPSQGSVR